MQSGLPSAKQSNDLTRALGYYDRYIALPDSVLGATASGLRYQALQSETAIYIELVDYKSAVASYKKMLKLEPRNYDLYLGIASNAADAGDKAGAIAAYTTFLKLDPTLAVRGPGQGRAGPAHGGGVGLAFARRHALTRRRTSVLRPAAR